MTSTSLALFDRQVETLVGKGYPGLAGMTEVAFRELMLQLRGAVEGLRLRPVDEAGGRLPLVIVVQSALVGAEEAMPLVLREQKTGHVSMQPVRPVDFAPIARLAIPASPAYLLVDVDRGAETLDVRPEDALKLIRKQRRSPLTIEEGVAIVTHHPEFLRRNNCFSLLGSRRADQRVPAIWIDGERRPKLGWCWDRNPHSWLGSASCKRRIGF